MSSNFKDTNYTIELLERYAYKYLQRIAKSMSLPANCKKTDMIRLIMLKNRGNQQELDYTITQIKQEQLRISQRRRRLKNYFNSHIPDVSPVNNFQPMTRAAAMVAAGRTRATSSLNKIDNINILDNGRECIVKINKTDIKRNYMSCSRGKRITMVNTQNRYAPEPYQNCLNTVKHGRQSVLPSVVRSQNIAVTQTCTSLSSKATLRMSRIRSVTLDEMTVSGVLNKNNMVIHNKIPVIPTNDNIYKEFTNKNVDSHRQVLQLTSSSETATMHYTNEDLQQNIAIIRQEENDLNNVLDSNVDPKSMNVYQENQNYEFVLVDEKNVEPRSPLQSYNYNDYGCVKGTDPGAMLMSTTSLNVLEPYFNLKTKDTTLPIINTTTGTHCLSALPTFTTVSHPNAMLASGSNNLHNNSYYSKSRSIGYQDVHNMANTRKDDMLEDAFMVISQDMTYMELLQCVLCAWIGPKMIIDDHLKRDHSSQIIMPKFDWTVRFSLGELIKNGYWSAVMKDYKENIFYILNVKYGYVGCIEVSLSVIKHENEPTRYGTITIFNKVTGKPFKWMGKIQPFTSRFPNDLDCYSLLLELVKLDLFPYGPNFLFQEQSRETLFCCLPSLNDVYIDVNVNIS